MKKKHHKQKHQKHTTSEYSTPNGTSLEITTTKFSFVKILIPLALFSIITVYGLQQYRQKQEPLPINMESLLATGTPYVGVTASKPSVESVATTTNATSSIQLSSATIKSLPLPKLPAKKPVESKTLKGQEAMDYIKSLPLDVQKQIMSAQSQGTTTPK